MKVACVVGALPNFMKIGPVIEGIRAFAGLEPVLVHTGHNYDYELNEIFFSDLTIRTPNHFLSTEGDTGAETIGNVIIAVDKVLAEIVPDSNGLARRCGYCRRNGKRF